MRRLLYVIAAIFLISACSGDDADTATTAAIAETTTTVATTTTSTTTTTTTSTTTTTTTTTTTLPPEDLTFDTAAGTPPYEFDSFTASMTINMQIGEVEVEATSEGVWTTDAFECTVSSGFGGFTVSESLVGTPETLWYDSGSGYEEASLFDPDAQSIISSCPASPIFWADFNTEDMGRITGEETTFNGRTAYQADLSDLMNALDGLGMAGMEGADINELTVFIDAETNTILSFTADLLIPGEVLGDPSGDTATMRMDFWLDDFNDPTLEVDLP